MKITSWNVNSLRARAHSVRTYLKEEAPDVLCLQETKCTDADFPQEIFDEAHYNTVICGQKSYNGVAIASKHPMSDVVRALPGAPDSSARYLEAIIEAPSGVVRVASIYAPNGNPMGTPKFQIKCKFLDALAAHARSLLAGEEAVALVGDYNVIPMPEDVWDAHAFADDALFQMESRQRLRRILNAGFIDALRACHAGGGPYTFWDYQGGAFARGRGLRIDHILLSPQAADRLETCAVAEDVRGWEKPSDHAPVFCVLSA